MFNRRNFLQFSTLSGLSLLIREFGERWDRVPPVAGKPIVVSTWAPNAAANAEAWKTLAAGGRAVDAVERGVQVPEADPRDQSVGFGGLPDRDGKVTLDACIMDEKGNCGSVMFLEDILHPIQVARLVMDKTPHVQLVGEGAQRLAIANGHKLQNMLTPDSEKSWREWLKIAKYDPMTIPNLLEKGAQYQMPGGANNHDTIGMIAMDAAGNLSGACTTSGMAFKMRGRVGDSPIIGAGLFVDNEVGAATATGVGEEVVRICGAHTVTELMRQGYKPEAACKKAVQRIIRMRGEKARDLQIGFVAINKQGTFGGFAMQKGFSYAARTGAGSKVYDAPSLY